MATFREAFEEGCSRPDIKTWFHISAMDTTLNKMITHYSLPEHLNFVAYPYQPSSAGQYCRVATCNKVNGEWRIEPCRILRPAVRRELIESLSRRG